MNTIDVKQLRETLGWTPEDLASKLGVSVRSVSRWEQGKRPTQAMLRHLRRLEKRAAKLRS